MPKKFAPVLKAVRFMRLKFKVEYKVYKRRKQIKDRNIP